MKDGDHTPSVQFVFHISIVFAPNEGSMCNTISFYT